MSQQTTQQYNSIATSATAAIVGAIARAAERTKRPLLALLVLLFPIAAYFYIESMAGMIREIQANKASIAATNEHFSASIHDEHQAKVDFSTRILCSTVRGMTEQQQAVEVGRWVAERTTVKLTHLHTLCESRAGREALDSCFFDVKMVCHL